MSREQTSDRSHLPSSRGRGRYHHQPGSNRLSVDHTSPHSTSASPSSVNSLHPHIASYPHRISPPHLYTSEMWTQHPSSPFFPQNMPPTPPTPTTNIPPTDTQAAGASSQQAGATDMDHKIWIRPYTDSAFEPSSIHRRMTKILKSKYEHLCNTWKSVPQEQKDIYFEEFTKNFRWDPANECEVIKVWNMKNAGLFRGMMEKVRKGDDIGEWIPESIRGQLREIWADPEYVKKREKGKMNRSSSAGGTTHTGGSISHSEHYKRLLEELGREPTSIELFLRTHQKKGTQDLVDTRATKAVMTTIG
ncbi:uncharacterized protein LOC120000734 isoform X2 [Tripterygium wilfordii]|uniref:uncharacterized protein LOC120000734 isoform X2 n=1 Tax=Tripterygium wilfordii TaxID=458696 RepID=UPI0018F81DA5|nr:uncharacterized protein LOC120000734 isoform X2 [Tripterygium wilfordii]